MYVFGVTMLHVNLRAYRKKAGLSQTELGRLVGMSKNSISSIECGGFCVTVRNALKLARALNCQVEDLFYLDPPFQLADPADDNHSVKE